MWFELSARLPSAAGVLAAVLLDAIAGDPPQLFHPVQAMGAAISGLTRVALARCSGRWPRRLAGMAIAGAAIAGSGAAGWASVWLARQVQPLAGAAVEVVLLASCFAANSLQRAAREVLQPLAAGELEQARSQLSRYVGRDTAELDATECARAVLETVAENTTDGVTAPLFYGTLGALLGPGGAAALALAYKAASTLDSTIGYRREPYADLGWFGAQLEDVLTWIPCRLTVLAVALLSGRPRTVWHCCRRDAPEDPSPNAGWSVCAFAASVGVQVGGKNVYQGVATFKPLLGDPERTVSFETATEVCRLARWCWGVWVAAAIAVLLLC